MIQLPDEINEELTPDLSKADIQAVKEEYQAEQEISDLEVMLEDKDEQVEKAETLLDKFMTKLRHDEKELYLDMMCLWQGEGEELVNHLAPAGTAIYNVRIPGAGRIMLSINENLPEITLTNMRSGEKETYPKLSLAAYMGACITEREAIQLWEETYGESWQLDDGETEEKNGEKPEPPKAAEQKKESKPKSKVVKAKVEKKPEENAEIQVESHDSTEESQAEEQTQENHSEKEEVAPVQPELSEETEPENDGTETEEDTIEPENSVASMEESVAGPEDVEVVSGEVEGVGASADGAAADTGTVTAPSYEEDKELEERVCEGSEDLSAGYRLVIERETGILEEALEQIRQSVKEQKFARALMALAKAHNALDTMQDAKDRYRVEV